MGQKITDQNLGGKRGKVSKSLLPKDGKAQVDHWIDGEKKLGARVSRGGTCSFFVWYRWKGKPRRDTLKPSYPALTLAAATAEALQTRLDIQAKRDPRLSDREPRKHYAPKRMNHANIPESYAEAVGEYVRRYQKGTKQNQSAGEVERALLKFGEDWDGLPLFEISGRDIRAKLEAVRDSGKLHMANHYHVYLSGFFSWCAEPGIEFVETSPMWGLKKPVSVKKLPKRTRADGSKPIFSDDELAAIWKAAGQIDPIHRAYIKLLLLTGKRPSAIAPMRWSEIDESGYWEPPESDAENKRLHSIPLPTFARQIIGALPKVEGTDFVLPGRNTGKHLIPGSNIKNKIRKNSGVEDFSVIYFRHTVETRLAGLGFSYEIRDAVLDHVPARGAGAGYDHHEYDKEKARALEAWSEAVQSILVKKKVWKKGIVPLAG